MSDCVALLGSYWTLAGAADPAADQRCHHELRRRVELASRAGFRGMGFWHADLAEIRRRHGFREMKQILDDHGIEHIEIEWLLDWYTSGARRAASDQTRQLLLEAAGALHARHIKIGDLHNDCAEVPKLTEEFALLCQQAAAQGTNVLFEMLPAQFSRAPSLDAVLSICHGAGERNGGIMLDNLHVQRTRTTPADIVRKIGRDIPLGVELNDGTLAESPRFEDSVINKRLLPGDGEFDIAAFLHAVWDLGYDGPVGVEVLNEYIRKWPLEVAAMEAFNKTSRVVASARQQWRPAHTSAR
ncbi:MAG: sugar phosphate isomerase/epimerase [Sinobacteraceae bacterium]|nr:sugar phosphate isomerase/epimerase [Nevskiaceae bacterium]